MLHLFSFVRIISTVRLFRHYSVSNIMVPPHSISLTVVGNGRLGSPKSVLIDTGICRYLVNCGECTQRILTESRSKASRIQHVYLTRMSWDHAAGLLGVALTAKAAGVKKLTIHGPPELEHLMQLTRPFADCETTDIVMSDIKKCYTDDAFRVQSFEVCKPNDLNEEPVPKRSKEDVYPCRHESTVFSYYFQSYRTRRKLVMSKCIEAGIPTSVLKSGAIQTLINGENLVLNDGRVITSEETTLPSAPPKNFLFIDCPDLDYIPAFMSNEQFFSTLVCKPSDEQLTSGVSFIVHFLPPGMFYSNEYQKLVERLEECSRQTTADGPDNENTGVKHLIIDGTGFITDRVGMYSQTFILNRFFDSTVYPLLHDMTDPDAISKRKKTIENPIDPFTPVVHAEPHMQFSLRPWRGYNKSEYPNLNADEFVSQVFDPLYMSLKEAEDQFAKMRESLKLNKPQDHRLASERYPEITFLGTGSSTPNKYRNISCILMQLDPDNFIMLDCGEGSLSQLYALYGLEKGNEILRKIKLILITHMHADHHGGVFTVALARWNLLRSDGVHKSNCLLPVCAPSAFYHWLVNFSQLFNYSPIVDLCVLSSVYTPPKPNSSSPAWTLNPTGEKTENWLQLLKQMNIHIRPVKVPHTRSSWAYIIDSPCLSSIDSIDESAIQNHDSERKWSIVYSGDTPSCPELVEAGRNCDLLIHEATMVDEHADLAIRARHSTTSGAIQTGRNMNAGFILLNHFSQRYGRLPPIDEFSPDVAASFDFMRVKFCDLPRLAYYIPYYQYAFAKHWAHSKSKADAYTCRKLREADELLEKNPPHTTVISSNNNNHNNSNNNPTLNDDQLLVSVNR
uniref:ribonuclease Z n=1 Tax=Trichobilharzia regenti TaxID=157069 RepID=A0AA85JLI0_TRIRE|nr:unnamed protein product [Trichobilharzia regenti]